MSSKLQPEVSVTPSLQKIAATVNTITGGAAQQPTNSAPPHASQLPQPQAMDITCALASQKNQLNSTHFHESASYSPKQGKVSSAADFKPKPETQAQKTQPQLVQPTHERTLQTEIMADASNVFESKFDIPHFSWREPHLLFVVILVGPDEKPFGVQKDFLCAKSAFFRDHFAKLNDETVEAIIRLPDTSDEIFGFAQQFLYTGAVLQDDDEVPTYDALAALWKVGHDLGIDGLCDEAVSVMLQVRIATESIPGSALLVKVWQDTPEGSSLRKLLLEWAAEYVRSSEANAEFAKSLPQEVLSELVLAMSRQETLPAAHAGVDGISSHAPTAAAMHRQPTHKVVHYMDQEDDDEIGGSPHIPVKKQRQFDAVPNAASPETPVQKHLAKTAIRRRALVSSGHHPADFTGDQKLEFCRDLLVRMLSGPGFWTRLVGAFRNPVDPVADKVPDYFEKITKPMDLMTIKGKMDRNEYISHDEFFDDVNQIFINCKTYWKPGDNLYLAVEKFEKTFMDKYSQMNKWISKMNNSEGH